MMSPISAIAMYNILYPLIITGEDLKEGSLNLQILLVRI